MTAATPGRASSPNRSRAFAARVLRLVSRIPAGRVSTYGDLARLAGRPASARAVGRILAAGTGPGLPYHRVVASGGLLGGYAPARASRSRCWPPRGWSSSGALAGFNRCRWTPPDPQATDRRHTTV